MSSRFSSHSEADASENLLENIQDMYHRQLHTVVLTAVEGWKIISHVTIDRPICATHSRNQNS